MNKRRISLSVLCALLSVHSVDAAVRVTTSGGAGRSYAGAYQQVSQMQQIIAHEQAIAITAVENTPVVIQDEALAAQIAANPGANAEVLDEMGRCAAIFPNGKFIWGRSDSGLMRRNVDQCVAVVEMRVIHGNNDIVLATANVAAGDTINCNIDEFPAVGWTADAGKITFPADREPTLDDVRRIMDSEQKQNAAMKTAAAVVLGGVGGHLLGERGQRGQSAAIGAVAAGGVTYGATQAGYVAGTTIMGAGVNMAAGAAIGNMMGIGNAVLLVKNCNVGGTGKCLWGLLRPGSAVENDTWVELETEQTFHCPNNRCSRMELIGYHIGGEYDPIAALADVRRPEFREILDRADRKCMDAAGNLTDDVFCDNPLYRIEGARRPGVSIPVAIADWNERTFGSKRADWNKWLADNADRDVTSVVHNRRGDSVDELITTTQARGARMRDFEPIWQDASSGALIDINNRARLGATLTGAGVGGALGGFAAYQGAIQDVENRWVTAVQEYRDSLQKIYCATGTRWLSGYNEVAIIPNVRD
ncbi:MAG: hypothetical protein FWF34_00675 [Alphaproteobacteria bacterium]|nr:hypothetical protein [Alphaproteobacteria bacterium]MCL2889760.1 hypothetical protein [Alphaproteobacteria bacterium]